MVELAQQGRFNEAFVVIRSTMGQSRQVAQVSSAPCSLHHVLHLAPVPLFPPPHTPLQAAVALVRSLTLFEAGCEQVCRKPGPDSCLHVLQGLVCPLAYWRS